MARFLSPEWFATLEDSSGFGESGAVIVSQAVTNTPWGDIEYRTAISPAGTRHTLAATTVAEAARVRLATDYETALEVHEGRLAVSVAILSGRIKVSGDIKKLAELTRRPS